jgi:hypothetical protein
VGITLVPYIPDYLVPGRVEDPVKGYGKLHYPKIGSQMASVSAYGTDNLFPNFPGKPVQFTKVKAFKVSWVTNGRQQFYTHQFTPERRNPGIRTEIKTPIMLSPSQNPDDSGEKRPKTRFFLSNPGPLSRSFSLGKPQ